MKTRVIGQEVRESEESPDQAYVRSKSKKTTYLENSNWQNGLWSRPQEIDCNSQTQMKCPQKEGRMYKRRLNIPRNWDVSTGSPKGMYKTRFK